MVRRGPKEASWGKISTQLLRAQQGELRRSPRGGKGEHKQGVPSPAASAARWRCASRW